MIENPHSNRSVEKQAGVNKFPRNINLFLQIHPAVHLSGMLLYKFTTSVTLSYQNIIHNTFHDQSESKFRNPICFYHHLGSLFNFCILALILIKLQFCLLTI